MRFDDLYLSGVGSWYPKPIQVSEALDLGWYDPALARRTAQQSVAVAGPDDSVPQMAVRAGRLAVRQAGLDPSDYRLLLHATSGFSGLDGWNVASYLQNEILDGHGVGFEVRQQSNGAMAAIELAAARLNAAQLSADPDAAVLITAADLFERPFWDRWSAYAGLVLGRGASAAVFSQRPGFARVISLSTVSRADLEGAQRAGLSFTANPEPADPQRYPVSLIDRMQEFATGHGGMAAVFRQMNDALRAAVGTAAAEAGIEAGDADHLIFPNFGRTMLTQEVLQPLGLEIARTTWPWSREVGHAGATDQFGALDELARAGRLRPGQRVLLTGIGLGFNWTAAVLEILAVPPSLPS